MRIQRLKDKLGDWSNASSEVEFHGARAPGWSARKGAASPTILQMVALTRQDCLIGSAALMRQALVQALHHARHRRAFGKRLLIDQPLMRNVLADLALESEAATALALRVARAVDAAPRDAGEAALARLPTALGKYWVCKRATAFVNEAQECLGGIGYVEDTLLPRLYRQAPLNSIWEGSGNIQCLDVLRALHREPACREAFFAEFGARGGRTPPARRGNGALHSGWTAIPRPGRSSRWLAERLALALQAACCCAAATPPWPPLSAPAAWASAAAWPSAPSRPASPRPTCSSARCRSELHDQRGAARTRRARRSEKARSATSARDGSGMGPWTPPGNSAICAGSFRRSAASSADQAPRSSPPCLSVRS